MIDGNGLTKKDIHCMARIIQTSVFAKGQIFYGCQYCKYWNGGCEEYVNSKAKSGEFHYDVIMKKLQQITGLDMGIQVKDLPDKFKERSTNQ